MTGKVVNQASQRITYHYGNGHKGVDIGWRSDENENRIFAHSTGTVTVAVSGKGRYPVDDNSLETYGNYVEIDHGNGFKTRYAHMRTVLVSPGQAVTANTQIGVIGESGYVTGRHLHFEVFQNNTRINPEPYLNQEFNGGSVSTGKKYQSHDSRYGWNPNVTMGSSEYAGNYGYNIDGIYLDHHIMRVHDMVKNQWLPWVQNRSDYAGNFGNAIDGVQIDSAAYRVHLNGGGWLDWVYKCDGTAEGYAGIYGRAIDAIQIKDL